MELVAGRVPAALSTPTGLGKTASVLLALLARLVNPELPRRVVYIVDRRAIVDQTAAVIRGWIDRIGALPELARALVIVRPWACTRAEVPWVADGRGAADALQCLERWPKQIIVGGHLGLGNHLTRSEI